MKNAFYILILLCCFSCSDDNNSTEPVIDNPSAEDLQTILQNTFGNNIDFDNLENYENQVIPNYITKDNTNGNNITDEKATLGRILFYDKNLSTNNMISCASCHQQQHAFSDVADVSSGVNGVTGRHSMRLVNSRFADEVRFFWDERALTLEDQVTQPIQDHAEMGFSGENGAEDFDGLISKLDDTEYYPAIFEYIYGNTTITEDRIKESLAQFVRSIQSFDSKYDVGRAQVANEGQPFPNFTDEENQGKTIFLMPPNQGGAGCAGCHRAPEFDIDPQSLNNGVFGVFGNTGTDFDVTRSPSLRDVVKQDGSLNGAFMHDSSLNSLAAVVAHYNSIDPTGITNLDPRLQGPPGGNGQQLNLTQAEIDALVAFLETLSGSDVYTNSKWSDPFQ